MRRTLSMLAAPFAVLLLLGCEGPEGPAGAAGPAGVAGPAGPAGVDQNETCTACHDDDIRIVVRQLQWEMSKHGSGENVNRATSTTCGICHGHEGFAERVESGFTITAATASTDNPTPINCRTCHQIHTTYTEADFNRVTADPVTMILDDEVIDLGPGNLCAQCHQPRPRDPFPVIDGSVTDPFEITSEHWGPHHSVQGGLLAGTGGVEFTGTKNYGVHTHGNQATNPDACITCHMAPALGIEAGGHTFAVRYVPEGEAGPEPEEGNEEGCETSGCHDSGLLTSPATDLLLFDHRDLRTYVQTLLEALETELATIGIYDAVAEHPVEDFMGSQVQAAALWNFLYIMEDHSLGVHNPTYAQALLINTLEALSAAVPPRP